MTKEEKTKLLKEATIYWNKNCVSKDLNPFKNIRLIDIDVSENGKGSIRNIVIDKYTLHPICEGPIMGVLINRERRRKDDENE